MTLLLIMLYSSVKDKDLKILYLFVIINPYLVYSYQIYLMIYFPLINLKPIIS